jgi:hypothetical protein
VAVWWAPGAHVVVRWRLRGSEVGLGAHVVVTWRLRGSEVGPGRSRGGEVARG